MSTEKCCSVAIDNDDSEGGGEFGVDEKVN